MKRGEKIIRALTILAAGVLGTLEFFDEFVPTYQSSYKRAHSRLYGSSVGKRRRSSFDPIESQKFYSLLNQLKRQELVHKEKTQDGVFWKITKAGLGKLKLLKEKKIDYKSESDNKLKIVVYDIPECERKKRIWLDEALKVLNFQKLQKSVCIGKSKIPEEFLFDLRKKQILKYVHILEVSKSGTVSELT